MWFHYNCFFTMNSPSHISDIAGFGNLRWEDQEKIKQHFSVDASEPQTNVDDVGSQLIDYQVDYAKSNESKCNACENKIDKQEIRIAIMVEGDLKQMSGKIPAWHHVDCFIEKSKEDPKLADIAEDHLSGCFSLL